MDGVFDASAGILGRLLSFLAGITNSFVTAVVERVLYSVPLISVGTLTSGKKQCSADQQVARQF